MLLEFHGLLAALPDGVYVNPYKLLGMTAMFSLWALYAQWVDKDTIRVNTFRILWNLITLSLGAVTLATLLLVPDFLIGALIYGLANLVLGIVYVVHRNGLVPDEDKVCTPQHFQRLMKEGFRSKKGGPKKEVKERVRVTGAGKKVVQIPEDDVEREHYRLMQDLLFDALWRRAQTVEVAPSGQAARVAYQVDGLPVDRDPFERADADAVITYFKKIAGLNVEEKRKPQVGKLMVAVGENKMDLVVRTDGSTAGEKLHLRFISFEKSLKVKDLGFTSEQEAQLTDLMHNRGKGLVLLSAPAASGLTTLVYSFARSHDAFLMNIQMLEYRRDLDIENITQNLFVPADDKTFSGELQKMLRTDPDIILVPEVRDKQTAVMCCEAANHKQKVYAGLNAASTSDAIGKWMRVVGDNATVSKALAAVLNGRLIRKLCSECKQAYRPDAATLKKMNMPADKIFYRPPEPQVDKHGNPIICQNCQGSGYFGRVGVYEVLIVDDALRAVLRAARSITEIEAQIAKSGSAGLQTAALQKVYDGTTSIQEVLRATRTPERPAPPAPPAAVKAG
ncbi:MAG: Flp pilus assembly complex ATPase component TadA [Planctomycetia bacterium]|nr:MAG: Flp pilus assembly complex ATPase component TadA [Planctomycetia bacterium]